MGLFEDPPPAPSPEALPTLLRAKIESKVTRPFSHPAAEYPRGFQFPRLYCGQSGEDRGRSGRGVQLLVLERHVKAGRRGGGCALKREVLLSSAREIS